MKIILNKLSGMEGKERVVEKFLLIPKVLGEEMRWLEKVEILQRVINVDVGESLEWGKFKCKWVDVKYLA